jgi:hypothetical protein
VTSFSRTVCGLFHESLRLYWLLVKIVLPVMLLSRAAVELGVVESLAPLFAPVMRLMGLPPELGFAWVTCVFVGLWGGAAAAFAVVDMAALSTAQVTVFASMMLITHALPIEQRIVQKAGPGLVSTTLFRVAGTFLYGFLLSRFYAATGWLAEPAIVIWAPEARTDEGWAAFAVDTVLTLFWMFVILFGLLSMMRLMEVTGINQRLTRVLAPVLRIAGISPQATALTMVGVLLGLAFGGGLILREAQAGHLAPRDIFLSLVFMGLCHSLIEDTLFMLALGADISGVLIGRVLFALAVMALVARLLPLVPERMFFRFLYKSTAPQPAA